MTHDLPDEVIKSFREYLDRKYTYVIVITTLKLAQKYYPILSKDKYLEKKKALFEKYKLKKKKPEDPTMNLS